MTDKPARLDARSLRDLVLDDAERSDEELAAEELGSADDDVVELPAASWRMLTSQGVDSLLLDLAEDDDTGAGLVAALRVRGVPKSCCGLANGWLWATAPPGWPCPGEKR